MSAEEFLNTKWTLRLRKIVNQQLLSVPKDNAILCEIGGDQTPFVNLYTELAELKNKIAVLEESTVDEETKRELKRIKNQIASLRAEGFSVPMGATYIPGMSYGDDRNKPPLEVYARGYGGNHRDVQDELKDVLRERFKDQLEELGLPEIEEPKEVDSGFDITINDPTKCHEPVFDKKTKSWRQCGKNHLEGSDYCHLHQKEDELKNKALAKW